MLVRTEMYACQSHSGHGNASAPSSTMVVPSVENLPGKAVNHNSDFELSITHYSGVIVRAISSKTMKLVRLRTGFDVHQNQCGNALHTEG